MGRIIFVLILVVLFKAGGGYGPNGEIRVPFLPKVPVTIHHREATFDHSKVAIFQNQRAECITFVIQIDGVSGKTSREMSLGPYSKKEIGWDDGYRFSIGDKIKVSCSGYHPIEYTV